MLPARAKTPGSVQRRPSRRWALPAVVTRDFTEPFDGWRILSEVPGNLGLALWQAVRDAELWAWAPEREGLFRPGAAERRRQILEAADVPAELTAALDVLTGLVTHPADVHPDLASMACSRLARWAEASGSLATALAFGQAAALARPERGRLAVEVGRLAAECGDPARGEAWLRRAVGLCRREMGAASHGATGAYARAWVELGNLYGARDEQDRARRAYVRAFRSSKRSGEREPRGQALWGLGRLDMRAGRYNEAEKVLRPALRLLRENFVARADVAHDLAEVWLRQGDAARAAPVLQRLLLERTTPGEQLRTLSLLCLAAAQCDDPSAASDAWHRAQAVSAELPPSASHALALQDLARGAAVAGESRRSVDAARRAAAMDAPETDRCTGLPAHALLNASSRPGESTSNWKSADPHRSATP